MPFQTGNFCQYVEFGGMDEEEGTDSDGLVVDNRLGLSLPSPNATKTNMQRTGSLEVLLAAKNKRIMEELARYRVCLCDFIHHQCTFVAQNVYQVLHAELDHSLRTSAEELEATKAELAEKRALTDKLENDLLQLEKRGVHSGRADTPSELATLAGDGLFDLDLGGKKSTPVSSYSKDIIVIC